MDELRGILHAYPGKRLYLEMPDEPDLDLFNILQHLVGSRVVIRYAMGVNYNHVMIEQEIVEDAHDG